MSHLPPARPPRCPVLERVCWPRVGDQVCRSQCGVAWGDREIWAVVLVHRRLVCAVAQRYADCAGHLSVDDLIEYGLLGLHRAVVGYDGRGALSSYAVPWIRHAVTRAIENYGRTIRLPVQTLAARRLLDAGLHEEEVARRTGMSPGLVREARYAPEEPGPLDEERLSCLF